MSAVPSPVPDRLERRYGSVGAAPAAAAAALSRTIETMLAHRSVRAWLDKPLAAGTLEAIVAAAQSASSSSNLQAWSVVAVEDPERRARLAKLAAEQAHVADCPLFLVWIADLSRLDRVARRHGVDPAALDYLEMFIVALVDAALAAQNAAVAAESLGLGTCYIGAVRNHPEGIAEEIGLPPLAMPAFGLCIGWPDPARLNSVKPRLEQPAVMHRERYAVANETGPLERYDAAMAAFFAENRMKGRDWSSQSSKRVSSPASLTGRDRLHEALEGFGFKLR